MLVQYLVRRAIQGFVVVFLVLTLLFVTARLTGDPIAYLVGGFVTTQDLAKLKHAYGLDSPLWVQYVKFLSSAIHFDFGNSIQTNEAALPLVVSRALVSLKLVSVAFILTLVLSVPLGSLAALKRGRTTDVAISFVSVLGQSVPSFVLGLVLVVIFGVNLHWLPTFGQGGIGHLILPVITLMGFPTARYVRLIRAQVSETLAFDYIRTARAKGLSESVILIRHILKVSLLPVVTLIGVDISLFISATVIVEQIFAWPGFGRLVLQAAETRDYPVLEASGFLIAVTVTLMSIIFDLAYGFFDPRLSVGHRA